VSKEIEERLADKDKFWLRKGDVWVRQTGGRDLATAEDFDTIYEGKLRVHRSEVIQCEMLIPRWPPPSEPGDQTNCPKRSANRPYRRIKDAG
jgi:hypothetical protein